VPYLLRSKNPTRIAEPASTSTLGILVSKQGRASSVTSINSASRFTSGVEMHTYKAMVDNIVDGDTVDVYIDLGFKIATKQRLRVAHIDTPERGQPNYKDAADAGRSLLLGKTVTIKTEKASKWGYYLAQITLESGEDYADKLVAMGLAKPYEGGTK
jgi:micrococcal nuclease